MEDKKMTDINNAPKVASVGSPSSNYEVTLDLNELGREQPLVGAMLALQNKMGDSTELAIGTVTEVTTRNRWHEDPNMRGTLIDGNIEGISGDSGDTRMATIRLQAAWRKDNDGNEWKPSGPSLRMSPATGNPVRLVDDGVIHELTEHTPDLHYMGHLGGTENVRLPLSMPDFATSSGAYHMGIYGQSGSGKAVSLETPIPTPHGWTTMGKIKDGDQIFDEKGNVCNVVKAHEVLFGRDCYEITFSDGTKIIADGEHLWQTETDYSRARQSLERNDYRKLNPLLPKEKTDELFQLAEACKPGDVITMGALEKLTGLTHGSSIMINAIKSVGVAGQVIPVIEFVYSDEEYTRSRRINAWPAQATFEALADIYEERKDLKVLTLAKKASREYSNETYLSMPQIARILNKPARNSALMRTLKNLNVISEVKDIETKVSPKPQSVFKNGTPVTTYPKKAILKYIANHCTNLRGDQRHKWIEPEVGIRTTKEILDTLYSPNARESLNHSVKVASALELPEAELPINPYLLGVWLGDGYSDTGAFCGEYKQIADILESYGFNLSVRQDIRKDNPNYGIWRIEGFTTLLREQGLIKEQGKPSRKQIPAEYLRASIEQRKELLAGLLDTDGTVSPNGTVHFDNTNKTLAYQTLEIARSLGYRATITSKIAKLNGEDKGTVYRVAWTTTNPVFKLTRKLEKLKERTLNFNVEKNNRRYIVNVEKVDSVPVRCITVDSESRLYLVSEAMIPTHNTQQVAYLLAGQMRHENQGFIIVDPQGQWAAEEGMAFSVQGFAAELGRRVSVRRISEHLRLTKDANLFCSLLGKTRFLQEFTKMSAETQELVLDEITKIVKDTDNWEDETSEELLKNTLLTLVNPNAKYISRIYADETRQERLREAIHDILEDSKRLKEVMRLFAPIHNLFQATNPLGGTRHSLWAEISAVFDRPANTPAPFLILDMSSKPAPGMNDEAAMAVADAYEVLENDAVKAAILRNIFSTLKKASEEQFRNGRNLNTMVALDEAWRYAPNPNGTEDKEIAELSRELAGYARDTRKFGIGWLYISQSTRSVNLNIWDQMSVRVFGFGLSGQDLEKMSEIVDDRNSLRLYRTFGNPRSTGRYPFLLTGPVSPLSANATPVVLQVYTDFQDFREDNHNWISASRAKQGLQIVSGNPVAPKHSAAKPLPRIDRKAAANPVKAIVETNKAVKSNLASSGIKNVDGYGDPLTSMGEEELPF